MGLVAANSLRIGYGKKGLAEPLTFTLEPGEILAIVGRNGAGKSTLIKTLFGSLAPVSGDVTIGGKPPAAYRTSAGIGYLPEVTTLPGAWRADGVLELARIAARAEPSEVRTALEAAHVDFELRVPCSQLSKGMSRRLGLAIALIGSPSLLLLDEPESGLDPGERIRLRTQIGLMSPSCVIVYATHDLREAHEIGTTALVFSGSGSVEHMTGSDFAPAHLEALFSSSADERSADESVVHPGLGLGGSE